MGVQDPGDEMHAKRRTTAQAQEFALSQQSDFSVLISNQINHVQ